MIGNVFSNNLKVALTLGLLILFSNLSVDGQVILNGYVFDNKGQPLEHAVINEKYTSNATYTDTKGYYELELKAGKKTIICSQVGFLQKEITKDIADKQTINLDFHLEQDPSTLLDGATVVAKSNIHILKETGFNVVAMDMAPFKNSSVSMTQVLDMTPGVKIREEGGVGSKTDVTINGLSGKHVRFFIDGMPMDAMSSAFQLNNLPINLAERIEVYKGVVPVNFGSDALGGAVNIVTKKTAGKYLDASYSYGSFNTHHTFVNTGITNKKGFTAQISAYQNYSDNDYYIDAKIKDFDTNLYSKTTQRVRRFHDVYHNETLIAKVGLVQKTYADQLLFGFTIGHVYDEIQNPAYINIAFGDKYQTSDIYMPSFLYSKDDLFIKDLNVSLAANYNLGGGHNYDISDKEYNWLGEWVYSNSLGEIDYSDYEYKNHNGTVNANINYLLNKDNRITINNVTNLYSREGDNKVVDDDYMNQKPRVNNRNILGASFNSSINSKLNASIFGKMYSYHASAYLDTTNTDGIDNFNILSREDSKFGYGATATYFILKNLQVKANFESTCRLPTSSELFGEVFGFYEANFDLEPEISKNFNFGFNYNLSINNLHFFNADVNFFYRRTSNYIKKDIDYSQGEGVFENVDLIKTPGIDAEFRYSYNNRFNCGVNVSYLDSKYYGEEETYYKVRLPNEPYLYGNADASYSFEDLLINESKLNLSYNLNYIHEFSYDWESYKASNADYIPTQWNHNFSVVYSWHKGRYNISFDCKNIFDAKLYDNYSLQKPGRSFSAKFRYFIQKK